MDHLLRGLAPISDEAWAEIEEEATRTLTQVLAARKIVDVTGPLGWQTGSVAIGRTSEATDGPRPGVEARVRRTQPLVELRTPFVVSRAELDAIGRGACDADLDPVRLAARAAALAEDTAVFHGFEPAGVAGIVGASPHEAIDIGDDYERYPSHVASAVALLQDAGVAGPYAIALGPRCYTGVIEQSEMGGYPVLKHLELILGGPVIWAPAVDGAVVVSLRGGDAELVLGQDLSIGYSSHDAESVSLYLEESFAVRLCAPEAAVHLAYT